LTYLEHEPDGGQRDAEIESHEDEVEFIGDFTKTNWRHLGPDRTNKPIAYTCRKSGTSSTDAERHNFGSIHPGDWPKRDTEDARNREQEEDTRARDAIFSGSGRTVYLGPQSSLADQRDTNSDRAKDQWLLPANLVEEEYDEEEVENGAYDVVDTGNKQVPIACDAKILV
jgi:hypothetical protein